MAKFLIKNQNDLIGLKPYQFIDCSYYLPNEQKIAFDISKKINPDDVFFDIDSVADMESNFKHMFPPKNIFLNYCIKNSINYGKNYIFYDHKGIFSAPRVFFTFLAYGFKNIFILDGGFSTLGCLNDYIESHETNSLDNFNLNDSFSFFIDNHYVKQALHSDKHKIIDARPKWRFEGVIPEPREGLKSGHIPNSINLPYTDLLTENKTYKSVSDIMVIFDDLGITKNHELIFTCGSGITACIVAFAALICDFKIDTIKIYDASWCEWGNGHFPVIA